MGKVYSDDIRLRVTGLVSDGASRRAAARRFAVSDSSAIRWAERAAKEGRPQSLLHWMTTAPESCK